MSLLPTALGRPRRSARMIPVMGALAGLSMLAGCQGGAPADGQATKAAAPAAASPASASRGQGPVLASYGGQDFTLEDYREAVGGLNARARKSLNENPDRRKQFVENHIVSKLIYNAGVERGFENDPDIERRLEELKEHLVVQKVMEEQQSSTVSDEDIQTYYDTHLSEFSTEKVKASHILVEDETLARDLKAKLDEDPSQFAALAEEHSKDLSNAKRGGDLGLFGHGRMVKEFEEAAFALEADGDISEPVQTRFGWHLIQRTGREDGSVQPFDQVKNQIKVKLVSENRRERTTGFIEELKKEADLTIHDDALETATLDEASAPSKDKKGSGH